ncbi:MAG: cohesin domain-containing protein [Eubacterium sp.]
MRIKKVILSLLIIFTVTYVCLGNQLISFAADEYIVSSDNITAKQGETITVPVTLTNNNGIMGFRITVRYPSSQLELTNISSGSITKDGLFNTTVTDYASVKGSFDVLWSSSSQVKGDGTLVMISFKIKNIASNGDYSISFSYSQEDTFNESFKDVKLKCSPVTVTVNDGSVPIEITESQTAKDENNEPQTTDKQIDVSDDYLIDSVKSVLISFGVNDIDSLTENQQNTLLEFVNNRIESFSPNAKKFDSFAELRVAYMNAIKNMAVDNVLQSTDGQVIIDTAEETLEKYNANSFSEIPDDKKKAAVDEAIGKLAESGADTSAFSNFNSYDNAAEALDEAVKKAEEQEQQSVTGERTENTDKNENNPSHKNTIIIVAVSLLAALALIVLILVIRRRK